MMDINKENIESYLLDLAEGSLNKQQQKEVLSFLDKNSEYKAIFEEYDAKLKLEDDEFLLYKHKDKLKHKIKPAYWKYFAYPLSTAAVVLLIFMVGKRSPVEENIIPQAKTQLAVTNKTNSTVKKYNLIAQEENISAKEENNKRKENISFVKSRVKNTEQVKQTKEKIIDLKQSENNQTYSEAETKDENRLLAQTKQINKEPVYDTITYITFRPRKRRNTASAIVSTVANGVKNWIGGRDDEEYYSNKDDNKYSF